MISSDNNDALYKRFNAASPQKDASQQSSALPDEFIDDPAKPASHSLIYQEGLAAFSSRGRPVQGGIDLQGGSAYKTLTFQKEEELRNSNMRFIKGDVYDRLQTLHSRHGSRRSLVPIKSREDIISEEIRVLKKLRISYLWFRVRIMTLAVTFVTRLQITSHKKDKVLLAEKSLDVFVDDMSEE